MSAKVHDVVLIPKTLLQKHLGNTNRQNRHTFNELRRNIRNEGFDENLVVVPNDDGVTYTIVSGNHRYDAGCLEGIEEFPCVVHEDWGRVKQEAQSVRRNYSRGRIDKQAFTSAIDALVDEEHILIDDVREAMGFEDLDAFMQLYQEQEAQLQQDILDASQRTTAPAVKMIDDLGLVLSAIFEKYGDTVPNSFIIFPAGGKQHLFIAANAGIVKVMQELCQYAIANHLDINMVLAGILAIGKANANFPTADAKQPIIEAAEVSGSEDF